MGTLDWEIGRVNETNDALLTGALSDVVVAINDTAEKAMSILTPSVMTVYENVYQTIRSPFQTLSQGKNWKKVLKSLPVVGADVAMKAARLPFAALDNAVQYVVNNNLERSIDLTKKSTTELIGNIISDKGNSRFALLRGAGQGVKEIGNGIGTIIKAPTGILAKITETVDEFLAKGTTKTHGWIQGIRASETDFIPRRHYDAITNTASRPELSNKAI